MLDKLKKVMNADVGKVLNADVGSIAKGAGKLLNADVGDVVAGTRKLLNTDLGDIFNAEEKEDADAPKKIAGTMPSKPAEDAQPADGEKGPPTAPGAATAQPQQTRLTEEIAVRHEYEKPYGQDIAQLLPVRVGDFTRPENEPSGKLATDPARGFYAGGGAKLEVEVGSYWDADEALERIGALRGKCASSKPSPDGTWMVGKSTAGITFAWMRESYVFAVTTQDAAALIRFLTAFPY